MNVISSPLTSHPPLRLSAEKGSVYSFSDSPEIVAFQAAILSALEHSLPGTVIPISYQGIILSASCQAATIGIALLEIVKGTYPDRFIIVSDPDGKNDWDADAALKKMSVENKRKLICVWHGPTDEVSLLGAVDPQVEATYRFVEKGYQRGNEVTARSFAEHHDLSIQTASNRMRKAAQLGIIYNAEERALEGGGKQNIFVPVE